MDYSCKSLKKPCTDSKIAEIADFIRAASLCSHVAQNIHLLSKCQSCFVFSGFKSCTLKPHLMHKHLDKTIKEKFLVCLTIKQYIYCAK